MLADKRIRDLAHGAVGIKVAPYDGFDGALYGGITGETRLKTGIGRGEVSAHQASFYKKKDPEGGVSLVLGAGNVASIPPMDVLYKMFVDGNVVILKMNPVNEYLGPVLERAFKYPWSTRGTSQSFTAAARSARTSATTTPSPRTCTSRGRTRRTISSCGVRRARSATIESGATTLS